MMLGDELDGHMVFKDGDLGILAHGLEQSALDIPAGVVLDVDDAVVVMAALPAEIELARSVARERDADIEEFLDPLRSLLDDQADGIFMAKAGSGSEGILDVELVRVPLVEN
ncbi:MAG: hypothetical protein BWY77_00173 [bacterium ADurb.Bin431]|nr:MAG: hypothetical protein BWY77_00173 [bacterium ADurb.Bin431]